MENSSLSTIHIEPLLFQNFGIIIGTHNGTIYNADYLFRRLGLPRYAEVDSELLFGWPTALLPTEPSTAEASAKPCACVAAK